MNRCQICQEPIWKSQWPSFKERIMHKFVCFYCFSKLKSCDYKPTIANKSDLVVCDRCGEVVENVKKTDSGWLCEDCVE